MSESLSEWLALRQAADWRSRSGALARRVCSRFLPEGSVRVLDLGTGSGSNVRYLIDRLPRRQRWLVVDTDPRLLVEMLAQTAAWAVGRGGEADVGRQGMRLRDARADCDVDTLLMDLDQLDSLSFEDHQLVTASALLDLVSERWLTVLAARCRDAGAAVLFAITYDGRSSCDPPEPEDDLVRELMNAHQRRDKGLGGPAAGPAAHAVARRVFGAAGYQVESQTSDWALAPDERALQRDLIVGWAEAATDLAPERATTIADWLRRRLAHVDAGRSRVTVGHSDLGAWLPRSSDAVRDSPR